jgi:hypothetical protein
LILRAVPFDFARYKKTLKAGADLARCYPSISALR